MLFDLEADVAEATDLAARYPEVVKRLTALADKARADLGDVNRKGKNQRPAGWVKKATPQLLKK